MSRYRITVTYTNRVVVEGDGDLALAEARQYELLSGLVHEEDHEVSSFGTDKPIGRLEMLANEDEDLWVEVLE